MELKEGLEVKLKINKKDKSFTYTIRKLFSTRISSDVFWYPFEIANLILSITVQSVTVKTRKHNCTVKFNLMDHPDTDLKISYSESGTFGNYDLAEALVSAEYSNKGVSSHLTKK